MMMRRQLLRREWLIFANGLIRAPFLKRACDETAPHRALLRWRQWRRMAAISKMTPRNFAGAKGSRAREDFQRMKKGRKDGRSARADAGGRRRRFPHFQPLSAASDGQQRRKRRGTEKVGEK